jgi:hypothetical protein
MKMRSLFNPRCTVFWATTYTFDVEAFESHLLPQLGGAPLNATVLADQSRLEADWAQLAACGELFQLGRAGRQYLLRGVEWPHRFHPKTYFFGRPDSGVLVVGSGNCGLNGLLNGNEVMATYASKDPEGIAAIREWARWMTRIVLGLSDPLCIEQWSSVRASLPWLTGAEAPSSFVHNLDETMRKQMTARVAGPIDELHLLAPYCDPAARAIGALLRDLNPKRVVIYAPDRMAVNGADLLRVLRRSNAHVAALKPDPPEFVHAKLIGIVKGDRGWLLSGSANLSQAALLRSGENANCEAGSLTEAPAGAIGKLFDESGLTWSPVPLEALSKLTHDLPPEPVARSLRLLRASVDEQRVISASFRSTVPGTDYRMRLWRTDDRPDVPATLSQGPDDGGVSVLTADPGSALLDDAYAVCLIVDGMVSGYVPIEEPTALRALLQANGRQRGDPDAFTVEDLSSPLGQFVRRIRERTDFSAVLEDPPIGRAVSPDDAGIDDSPTGGDVLIEDLEVIIRRQRSLRHQQQHGQHPTIDELLAEIEALRNQAPPVSRHPHGIGKHNGVPPGPIKPGPPQPPTKRLQMLLGNALDRMCRAAGDRRIFDRDAAQAGRNIETLIDVLHACHFRHEVDDFLSAERIPTLVEHLMLGLAGEDDSTGLLHRLSPLEIGELLEAIPAESRRRFGGLVGSELAANTAQGRERIYKLQPALRTCLATGVLMAADHKNGQRLEVLLRFSDSDHWIKRMWREYHVGVRIYETRAGQWLLLAHPVSVLGDPVAVRVVAEWMRHAPPPEGAPHIGLANHDSYAKEGLGTTRLSITIGATAWLATKDEPARQSEIKITQRVIDRLLSDQKPWLELFPAAVGALSRSSVA